MEKTEFEFPDEKENPRKGGRVINPDAQLSIEMDDASDTEIEIVDDTPSKPDNYKEMNDPPKDLDEEELSNYGEKVRKRLQHLQKGYHEERRKAEQASKEREEAVRAAHLVVEENKKLKGSLSQGQSALVEQSKKVLASELDQAKRQYREAYEAGDSEALVNAQEYLTLVKIKAERVDNFRPNPLQEQENEVKTQQEVNKPLYVDQKAQKWRQNNQWFGDDDEMTSFALGLHNKLVKSGVDPTTENYYERVNARMRQVFPDYFESDGSADEPEREVKRQKSNVVAPATRSSSPKKVVLSQTQVNIAKRLGVPLELYARKVAEQMRTI
jgi:hypothetical protein